MPTHFKSIGDNMLKRTLKEGASLKVVEKAEDGTITRVLKTEGEVVEVTEAQAVAFKDKFVKTPTTPVPAEGADDKKSDPVKQPTQQTKPVTQQTKP